MADVSSDTDDNNCSESSSHGWELVGSDQNLSADALALEQDHETFSFVPDASGSLQMNYFTVLFESTSQAASEKEEMTDASSCEQMAGSDNRQTDGATSFTETAMKEERLTCIVLHQEGETSKTKSVSVYASANVTGSCDEMAVPDDDLKFVTLDHERDTLITSRGATQERSRIVDEEICLQSRVSTREVPYVQELDEGIVQRLDGIETPTKEEDGLPRRWNPPNIADETKSETELSELIEVGFVPSLSTSAGPSSSAVSECSVLDGKDSVSEAWWRRQTSLLQIGGGQGNTFWSIAMAATVVSILILGHRWHRARIQNKKLRIELDTKEKKISQLMYQLVRMKECICYTKQIPVVHAHSTLLASFQTAAETWL